MLVAALIGVGGGILSGLFGVGGGVLFVPALVLAGHLAQVDAEATSLVAIVPVAIVGAYRQRGYGNVRLGDGVRLGVLAAAGAVGGVALANVLPTRVLELGFAGLMYVVAVQMARRGWRGDSGVVEQPGDAGVVGNDVGESGDV